MIFTDTIALVAAYFLGAIPFAVIISRRHGVDILKAGSGNPGATNVKRVVGKGPGNLCFALDALKGTLAVLLARFLHSNEAEWLPAAALGCALLGHSFSVFIRFRGGKGVATTMGGLLALMPLTLAAGAIAWVVVFYASRYVSLASLVFGLVLFPVAWLRGEGAVNLGVCIALCILLFVRHRSNIVRLLNGTENRFERKPKA